MGFTVHNNGHWAVQYHLAHRTLVEVLIQKCNNTVEKGSSNLPKVTQKLWEPDF